jgi:hypothetical protein
VCANFGRVLSGDPRRDSVELGQTLGVEMGWKLSVAESGSFELSREQLQGTLSDVRNFQWWFPWLTAAPTPDVLAEGHPGTVGQRISHRDQTGGAVDLIVRSILVQSRQTTIKCDLRLEGAYSFTGDCVFQLEDASSTDGLKSSVLEWRVLGSLPYRSLFGRSHCQELLAHALQRGFRHLRSFLTAGGPVQELGVAEVLQVPAHHLLTRAPTGELNASSESLPAGFLALAGLLHERNLPAPDFWLVQFSPGVHAIEWASGEVSAGYRQDTVLTVQPPLVHHAISPHRVVQASYRGPAELLGNAGAYLQNVLRSGRIPAAQDRGFQVVVPHAADSGAFELPPLHSVVCEVRVPLLPPKG